jgi:hypothetical protein
MNMQQGTELPYFHIVVANFRPELSSYSINPMGVCIPQLLHGRKASGPATVDLCE